MPSPPITRWLLGAAAGALVSALGALGWLIAEPLGAQQAETIGTWAMTLGVFILGGTIGKIAFEADEAGDKKVVAEWGLLGSFLLLGGLLALWIAEVAGWWWAGSFFYWILVMAFIGGVVGTLVCLDRLSTLAGRPAARKLGWLAAASWAIGALFVEPLRVLEEMAVVLLVGVPCLLLCAMTFDVWLWGEEI